MANSPIRIQNLTLTGGQQSVQIPANCNTIVLQTRDKTDFQVRQPGISKYFSVLDGKALTLNSYNFTEAEYIEVTGTASSVLEIMTFIRG